MGNRATITFAPFRKSAPCIYIHWNGGRASVEAFCKAAKELGYRSPKYDATYGFARLTGLICAFNGLNSETGVGIGLVGDLIGAGDDNGCYVIGDDWEIVERRDGDGKIIDMSKDTFEYDVDEFAANLVNDIRAADAAIDEQRQIRSDMARAKKLAEEAAQKVGDAA